MSLGIREYARHRKAAGLAGGTHKAVAAAIASGRLSSSLTADRKGIADAALADAEWVGTTLADRVPNTGPTAPGAPPAPPAPNPLLAFRLRQESVAAELAELELAKLKGGLIDVDKARSDVMSAYGVIKSHLRGVASRLRQQSTTISPADAALVADLIDAALTELADPAAFAALELAR